MSDSDNADVVSSNVEEMGYEVVFMDGQYDSIISINRNKLDKLSSDNKDVPNDFYTTYIW